MWLPVFGVTCCIQSEGTKNMQQMPLTCEVDKLSSLSPPQQPFIFILPLVYKYTHISEHNTLYSSPISEA
jgi:hypothetical protein